MFVCLFSFVSFNQCFIVFSVEFKFENALNTIPTKLMTNTFFLLRLHTDYKLLDSMYAIVATAIIWNDIAHTKRQHLLCRRWDEKDFTMSFRFDWFRLGLRFFLACSFDCVVLLLLVLLFLVLLVFFSLLGCFRSLPVHSQWNSRMNYIRRPLFSLQCNILLSFDVNVGYLVSACGCCVMRSL